MASERSSNTLPRSHVGTRTGPAWMVLALVCCLPVHGNPGLGHREPGPACDRPGPALLHRGLAWVVNGYLLTFAGFMLLGGRAADLFGTRLLMVGGLFLFAASSLVAGLATTPGALVGRIVEGLGAAAMAPCTLAVINTNFTEERERARAFGAWSASGGVGGMAGAIAGGAITTGLSWRWVFFINVPIGAALIVVAVVALTGAAASRREPLDLVGAVAGTAGLAAVVFGVMQSTGHGWSVPDGGRSARGRPGAARRLRPGRGALRPAADAPAAVPQSVGAVGSGMLFLFGGIAIAMWYFTSLFMQDVLGYSALRARLGQTPAAVVFMLVARWASTVLPKTGPRALVLAGLCLLPCRVRLARPSRVGSGYLAHVLCPTLLIALGIGLTFPTFMAASTAGVSGSDAGIVGGVAVTANQVGGAVGVGGAGNRRRRTHRGETRRRADPGPCPLGRRRARVLHRGGTRRSHHAGQPAAAAAPPQRLTMAGCAAAGGIRHRTPSAPTGSAPACRRRGVDGCPQCAGKGTAARLPPGWSGPRRPAGRP